MTAGGAHCSHSQSMHLLRRGVDSTISTSEGGALPVHVFDEQYITDLMKKVLTLQGKSFQSVVEKMGPRCCLRRSQEATRDKPKSPVLIHLLCTQSSAAERL